MKTIKKSNLTQFEGTETETGDFFWKRKWYSICSKHKDHNFGCSKCQVGSWHYVSLMAISERLYLRFPGFWAWWIKNI